MILYCIVNECCRVLGEKIVARPEDLDVGSIYGYGFPPFRYLFDSVVLIYLFL
jgi:hypothetical protein